MDDSSLFRGLVATRANFDVHYIRHQFSFSTVCYKSAHLYCCCSCGFEHEYFDYLLEDGSINEEMLDKVVENIFKDRCPHVDTVPDEYVKTSNVYGCHLAATGCKDDEFWKKLRQNVYMQTALFGLNVYEIAVIKRNLKTLEILCSYVDCSAFGHDLSRKYLCVKRSDHSKEQFVFQLLTLLEFCVTNRDIPMLETLLKSGVTFNSITSALTLAFTHQLEDVQTLLIQYIRSFAAKGKVINTLLCAETAIICNKANALDDILTDLPPPLPKLSSWFGESISLLRRSTCEEVILKYDKSVISKPPTMTSVYRLMSYLHNFYDQCNDQVLDAFHTDSRILNAIKDTDPNRGSHAHVYLNPEKRRVDTRVLKTIFDFGVAIDKTDESGNTPLTHWLKKRNGFKLTYKGFYATLETLINENPNPSLNESAVCLGLEIDGSHTPHPIDKQLAGETPDYYWLDGKTHSLFEDESNYAMNFIAPYLIECGFPIKRDKLLDVLDEDLLPPEVLQYLQHYLNTPRNLMLQCRDVLRKHFRGRSLHKYVVHVSIPKSLQDFILIAPVIQV